MSSVFNTLLIVTYLFKSTLSEFLNSTIIVDLYLTISGESQLIISDNDIENLISSAFTSSNEANLIYDVINIDFTFNYHYYNEDNNNNYEYRCILYMYFDTENHYNNGYSRYKSNSLNTYINHFETNLFTEFSYTNNINKILINEMKIISLDLDENIGEMIINYNGDVTTTPSPTQLTLNPSTFPTKTPSKSPITTTTTDTASNSSNYTFSNEGTYWILLILFLFIGCCIGCCCWYFIFIRMDLNNIIKQRMDDQKRNNNTKTIENTNKKQANVSIEMSNKKKKRKNKKRKKKKPLTYVPSNTQTEKKENVTTTEEELKAKRDRYIEYGSEDDSAQEEAFKMPTKTKRKRNETNETNTTEISDDDSVENIVTTNGNNSSDSDNKPKKKRNKNKKSGNIEPERYDYTGQRQLTTKELMAQYKKNRQKGGDSIDLSYKVGTKKKKNAMEQKEGDNVSESEGDEYEFDVERPVKLDKINEKYKSNKKRKKMVKRHGRNNTGDLNRKKRNEYAKGKHKRSNTATLTNKRRRRSKSPNAPKISKRNSNKKYKRPKSAKIGGRNERKYKRPNSARHVKKKVRKKKNDFRRQSKYDSSGDSDEESMESDRYNKYKNESDSMDDESNYTPPQPKDVRDDDYEDESSEY